MSEERVWPGPRDLIEYLKQPGIKKAKEMFADGDGRCCLGHYADLCHLNYDPDEKSFGASDSDDYSTWLPLDHWLWTETESDHSYLQFELAALNDQSPDFGPVIDRLEEFAAECEAAE